MKIDLFKLASIYYALASDLEELPQNSKNIKTILKNLDDLVTYHARIEYADENLKFIDHGSSRCVYELPNNKILKIAKNDKGIAQNKCEAKIKSKYTNTVLSHSKDYYWIECNKLKELTATRFKEIVGFTFKSFGEAIEHDLGKDKKPDNYNEIKESDIFKEIVDLSKKYKLMPGDLAKISSYGEKNDIPVLIDAGLSKEIYEEFYKP